jgi:hypothetical protein
MNLKNPRGSFIRFSWGKRAWGNMFASSKESQGSVFLHFVLFIPNEDDNTKKKQIRLDDAKGNGL